MIKLATSNGSTLTPAGLRSLELLARWRATLDIDTPLAAIAHPIWMVRKSVLDRLTSETRDWRASRTRRLLTQRLPPERVDRFPRWITLIQSNGQPTRADFGDWLTLVTDEDPAVAALGDYFLRRRFGRGPEFNPNGTADHKRMVRQHWASLIVR